MAKIELTSSQRAAMTALVNEYDSTGEPVKGDVIAAAVDRTPGTVRNQMQHLKDLSLVEGLTGPNGGYKPTPLAYDALGREEIDDPRTMTLARNNERVDITVDGIRLSSVHHPEECRAHIHLQESFTQFDIGDAVVVGPTPLSRLLVAGVVEAVDESNNEIIVDIAQLEAPVEGPD
ncbi:TrmB family transcriptional regulator [Halomicroarcula sp. GCM10025324]|jgi:predicted transcriptional regulator|uniref:TrmB family transcriptional regulator n=1 Tax=Haloarcula TaxID=2237 RepID=UPI0023E79797|nr:TrmB family transcriptional regulator [Halomicroarcula sp. ZS-22-S1]